MKEILNILLDFIISYTLIFIFCQITSLNN